MIIAFLIINSLAIIFLLVVAVKNDTKWTIHERIYLEDAKQFNALIRALASANVVWVKPFKQHGEDWFDGNENIKVFTESKLFWETVKKEKVKDIESTINILHLHKKEE